MRRLLFDTGVYADYFRRGQHAHLVEGRGAGLVAHLSAVVAEELLVGAPNRRALRLLEDQVQRFLGVGRFEVPTTGDWLRVGHVLREVGQLQGCEHVRRARLTNDALIAATALRLGATVLTRNAQDFALLHDHLPVSLLEV